MYKENSRRKILNKGSLMVEVIIVVSVIVASTLAALAVTQKSISLSRQSTNQAQAAFLLEEGAEGVRIIRDNAWSGISSSAVDTDYYLLFSSGTWTLSSSPSTVGIFTRKVVFSNAYRDGSQDLASSGTSDDQARLVTITVDWLEGTKTMSKTLQFYIMDIFS